MQTLFRTLITAFSCMFYFSGFDEKEVNGKPTKSFTRGRRAVYFGRRKKKKRSERKFRENRKVPRVLGGRANNFVGYKSNAISRARGGIWSGGVHYGKKARRREVTKNLVPSETNHLGTFCDGTRGNRGSFRAARYIFQYSRNQRCGVVK